MKEPRQDLSELVDIREVVIDRDLPKEERIKSYLQQIKNPYCFKVGNIKVNVAYSDTERTLDDSVAALLSSL